MTSISSYPNKSFRDIRLIIFDLDGTLVDAFADITAAVNYMLERAGRPPFTIEQVKKHVGSGSRALVAGIFAVDDPEIIERHHKDLVAYYRANSSAHATIYEKVVETVQQLAARNIRMAIVSNKPDALTQKVTRKLGLHTLFDLVSGESPRFPRKPAADILQHIMQQFNAGPGQTLVVGDSCVDIQFARAAGVAVVAVTYGQTAADELCQHQPDALIHSIADLPPLLL
jgi:phosphoglycolate phosphatase